ncbi:MAG: hypothetical protein EBZ50_04505 [Alphaproteobacteria bacterium]|nr:hypothetical protein [Alphaproteobacteria bacterium]
MAGEEVVTAEARGALLGRIKDVDIGRLPVFDHFQPEIGFVAQPHLERRDIAAGAALLIRLRRVGACEVAPDGLDEARSAAAFGPKLGAKFFVRGPDVLGPEFPGFDEIGREVVARPLPGAALRRAWGGTIGGGYNYPIRIRL